MARKLASIQRIKDLVAIAGADRIELALVQGWQAVVKKGEFAVGDLCVYFEIDSWVPTTVAPFLTGEGKEPKEFEGVKGERLRTVKLRKQLSQGLVLRLEDVKAFLTAKPAQFEEGDDITAALGVLKWEMPEKENTSQGPASSAGRKFPAFIRKTDEERIQNYGALVERELDTEFECSTKKDGSSLTVFRVDQRSPFYSDAKAMYAVRRSLWQKVKDFFVKPAQEPVYGICSRNVLLPLEGGSNFHKAAAPVLAAMKTYDAIMPLRSYAVQGELVAPDIQGNYEKVEGIELHVFNLFDIDGQEYVLPQERRCLISSLGINHVNVAAEGKLRDILGYKDGDDVVKLALAYAEGPGDNKGVSREGVVMKAMNKDFSFKAVANSYLLATGK